MPSIEDMKSWQGRDAHGQDGTLGLVEGIYLDDETAEPEWLGVATEGGQISFVPVSEATHSAEGVRLPYTREKVLSAPRTQSAGHLSADEEAALYRHYGRDYSPMPAQAERPAGQRGVVGHDTSGPTTENAMTRSEEELRVGKIQVETGRVRLRKYIVTEQVETTVPVQREEVRIEREPITGANVGNAMDGPALSEEEHEVVLHAEEPVVEKRVVPKERVRIEKDAVIEEQTVTGELRKERIEAEGEVQE
jgi:uncharacterized protein (TIGR02271 family)